MSKMNYPVVDFVPAYPDVRTYARIFGKELTWEADNWIDVCKSWFDSSYIHAGISGAEDTISGPDAQKLISDASINNVSNWKNGKCKHLVQLDRDGLITNHALFVRDSETSFRTFAGITYAVQRLMATNSYDVEVTSRQVFVFQFSGPKALTILEALTQQSLRDVKFLDTRAVTIPGLDAEVEICRIGMSGTISYELRGAKADGPAVYDAAYEAGKPYGIKRMGWRTYTVNHMFGGFPQQTVSFESSLYQDPEFMKISLGNLIPSGSVEPENMRARFRTPVEIDWLWMSKFDHDFVGRDVMEKEAANPKRKIVNLLWNTEDIIDIYASQYRDKEPYKYMEMPCAEQQPCGGHQDYVTTLDGKKIGYASVATYSSHYQQTISQCVIDIDQAELGNEVLIQWGDYGKKIKNVRATVVRYPYIDIVRNEDYDLSTVQSGI